MKKIIVLAAVVALVASLSATAFGALTRYFSDEATFATWFAPSAQKMKYNGIINGYADGSFGANKKVNRAELAVMLDKFATAIGKPLTDPERGCTLDERVGLAIVLQDQKGNAVTKANISVVKLTGTEDLGFFQEYRPGEYSGYGGNGYYTFKITKTGFVDYAETVKLEQYEGDCHTIPQIKTITLISKS